MHIPPVIALVLTLAFIGWLYRRDIRERPNVTPALWLPLCWMLLSMSRLPSQWLNAIGLPIMGHSMEEGNPFDAAIYFGLIAAGIYVLNRRQVSLAAVIRNNAWFTLYFAFCFVAIVWSDFPFVAFKRWIKILGHPVMVLVLLTEPDPEESLVRLMKRTAFVILPISILFIKYFEDLGRGYDDWSGQAYNTGITLDKNALGYDCLVLGFFFVWHFMKTRHLARSPYRRKELLWDIAFLYMIWWLLSAAHSSTSLVSLMVGVLVMIFLGLPFVNKKQACTYLIAIAVSVVLIESFFGASSVVIKLLGKDPTLTGRTRIWDELLALGTNPIIGTGFESFWLGDRLQIIWDKHWWHPNEAHNGYLETYLNLGAVGLLILCGLLASAFLRGGRELMRNFNFGRFRLGFLAALLIYNWTESACKGLHPMWFVFLIIALEYPQLQASPQFASEADEHYESETAIHLSAAQKQSTGVIF